MYTCILWDESEDSEFKDPNFKCDKHVYKTDWLCKSHHEEFCTLKDSQGKIIGNLKYKDYPEWIKELITIERKKRGIDDKEFELLNNPVGEDGETEFIELISNRVVTADRLWTFIPDENELRDIEIRKMLINGCSYREIAKELKVSFRIISEIKRNI